MRGQLCNICRSAWLDVIDPVRRAFRYALLVLHRDGQAAYFDPTHTLSVFPPRAIRRPGPQPGLPCVWEFLAVWLKQNVLLAYGAFSQAGKGCLAARPAAPSCRSTSSRSTVPPFAHRRINRPSIGPPYSCKAGWRRELRAGGRRIRTRPARSRRTSSLPAVIEYHCLPPRRVGTLRRVNSRDIA